MGRKAKGRLVATVWLGNTSSVGGRWKDGVVRRVRIEGPVLVGERSGTVGMGSLNIVMERKRDAMLGPGEPGAGR